MNYLIALKDKSGIEIETFEIQAKHSGDALQNLENELCNKISPYNTYLLKNCRNIFKKASKKTLHFKDGQDKNLTYIIEIKDADFGKNK